MASQPSMNHDCQSLGHVWLTVTDGTTDNTPYIRHRGRTSATVSVRCQFCDASTELKRHAGFSGTRAPSQPIDTTIPPQFMKVVERAVAEANQGPASPDTAD